MPGIIGKITGIIGKIKGIFKRVFTLARVIGIVAVIAAFVYLKSQLEPKIKEAEEYARKAEAAMKQAERAAKVADSLLKKIQEIDVIGINQQLQEAIADYNEISSNLHTMKRDYDSTVTKLQNLATASRQYNNRIRQLQEAVVLQPAAPYSGLMGRIELTAPTEIVNGVEKRNFTLYFSDKTSFQVRFAGKN